MARLQEIDRVVGEVLDHARKTGDVRLGLAANAEARANALAYLRLRGDISEEPSEDWTVEFEKAP
jgi:hypothetical protein